MTMTFDQVVGFCYIVAPMMVWLEWRIRKLENMARPPTDGNMARPSAGNAARPQDDGKMARPLGLRGKMARAQDGETSPWHL